MKIVNNKDKIKTKWSIISRIFILINGGNNTFFILTKKKKKKERTPTEWCTIEAGDFFTF